jgi:hypothetical protein
MAPPLELDDIIPSPHFRERHERVIAAPAGAVWDALWRLRLDDLALSRTLMRVRAFGRDLPMVTEPFLERGPVPVLGFETGRAVVAGGALQPWKPFGGSRPPALDAAGLRALDEPGWVKVGVDFVVGERGASTVLTTETRVVATDRRTRVLFGVYWALIRVGSGLIRRDMLRAVARAAE